MYSVTKIIHFCYGHRLMNYSGKCRHLHGHNGKVEVELQSDALDERGMVYDFGDIKRTLQQWIDDNLDHATLLRKDDPFCDILRTHEQQLFVMDENPTAESIAKLIFEYARSEGLPVSSVRLWETPKSFASYCG